MDFIENKYFQLHFNGKIELYTLKVPFNKVDNKNKAKSFTRWYLDALVIIVGIASYQRSTLVRVK